MVDLIGILAGAADRLLLDVMTLLAACMGITAFFRYLNSRWLKK